MLLRLRLIGWLSLFVAAWWLPRSALAQGAVSTNLDDHVVISLDVDPTDTPDYVCLVTNTDPRPDPRHPDPEVGAGWVDLDSAELKELLAHPENGEGSTYYFEGTYDGLKAVKGADYVLKAAKALAAQQPDALCTTGPRNACRPRVVWDNAKPDRAQTEAAAAAAAPQGPKPPAKPAAVARAAPLPKGPPTRLLLCRENLRRQTAADTDAPSVLVLHLRFTSGQLNSVRNMVVAANVLDLYLTHGFGASDVAEVSVLGGHYVEGHAFLSAGDRVVASIAPRCRRHVLVAPPFVGPPGAAAQFKASLGTSEAADSVCVTHAIAFDAASRASVWLPYNAAGASLILTVTSDFAELRAWWADAVASPTVALLATSVSFGWTPPCLAQNYTCPAAILSDVGVTCQRVGFGCSYRCPASATKGGPQANAVAFDIPTTVRFSDAVGNSWPVKLGYANQLLEGYIAPDEHYVSVSFREWGDAEALSLRPWEAIDHVEIKVPGGGIVLLKPASGLQRLRVPGVSCKDYVAYRIVGDRGYREKTVQVEGGIVTLDPPQDLVADTVTYGLTVGGGAYSPWGAPFDSVVRPYFIVEAVASFRPLHTGAIGYSTWSLARPWFEIRAGYLFSTQWYVGVAAPGTDNRHDALYNRFPLSVMAQFPLPGDFEFGLGPGVAYGAAIQHADFARVGDTQFSFMPVFDVGYRPDQSHIALEGTLRFLVNERLEEFDTDFRSTPVRNDIYRTPWFAEVKLRVNR